MRWSRRGALKKAMMACVLNEYPMFCGVSSQEYVHQLELCWLCHYEDWLQHGEGQQRQLVAS
eukprot:2244777-Amphidinium_carterae.1